MAEQVAVLGAGMAGLGIALALAPTGREITLFDRDPPAPEGGLERAFDDWTRRGASQFRHSHAFLARLRALIAGEHPRLLEALRAAGARELQFADGLSPQLLADYAPDPGDEELAIIVSRRSTFEAVMRAYVESFANVRIVSEQHVTGLVLETADDSALIARGLKLEGGKTCLADLVIDAAGRNSGVVDWLRAAGARVDEEAAPCSILYYTRFYETQAGRSDPARSRFAGSGDLGFLKFAIFPADNGTFSITLAVPEVEERLRAAVVRPEIFDRICERLPGVAPWTDPAHARPVSKVHAMGELESRWRDFVVGGRPAARNLFSVGDSLARTNPLYGRGCSFAVIEAHLLRDVLGSEADPDARALAYDRVVRRELRPFYDDMARQDRSAAKRADAELDPDAKRSLRSRLVQRFVEDGVTIALRQDIELFRQAMRAFHMLADPGRWLMRPATLAKVMRVWARGRRANAPLYREPPGPGRLEMLAALDLPATAKLA